MNNKEVQTLLERYLDGLTTNEEEGRLRDYFTRAGQPVPAEWRVYRALFAYEQAEAAALQQQAAAPSATLRQGFKRRWLPLVLAVAAAAAVLLVLVMQLPTSGNNYAVIDGKVIRNKKIINREAEASLNMVSADADEDFDALFQMETAI
jgi:hypothetical protein